MAVKYVSDFEFPTDFGFQKSSKVGTTVPGKHGSKQAFAKGGSTTPQPYAKGGFSSLGKGTMKARDTGISKPAHKLGGAIHGGQSKRTPPMSKGMGASDVKYKQGSDSIFKGSSSEKSSGVQSPAFKHGGKAERNAAIMKVHMKRHAKGGSISADIADDPVPMGKKSSWNKDDAVSPGSAKRNPPAASAKNKAAASDKFATKGENTEPATKQTGDVERMSGWSDFKKGGKVKHKHAKGGHIMDREEKKAMKPDRKRNMGENPQAGGHDTKKSSTPYDYKKGGHAKGCSCKMCGGGAAMKEGGSTTPQPYKKGGHDRIKNLGHYAHGGKVWKDGSTQKPGGDEKYEKAAGTPKKSHDGTKGERESGTSYGGVKRASKVKAGAESTQKPKDGAASTRHEVRSASPVDGIEPLAGGGLTRGTSAKRNAAIHAHEHQKAHPGGLGALAAMMGASGAMKQPSAPGMGATPPGMAPGMGQPPGGQVGGMAPAVGPMGPGMSHGGKVTHVMHHHIRYGKP